MTALLTIRFGAGLRVGFVVDRGDLAADVFFAAGFLTVGVFLVFDFAVVVLRLAAFGLVVALDDAGFLAVDFARAVVFDLLPLVRLVVEAFEVVLFAVDFDPPEVFLVVAFLAAGFREEEAFFAVGLFEAEAFRAAGFFAEAFFAAGFFAAGFLAVDLFAAGFDFDFDAELFDVDLDLDAVLLLDGFFFAAAFLVVAISCVLPIQKSITT